MAKIKGIPTGYENKDTIRVTFTGDDTLVDLFTKNKEYDLKVIQEGEFCSNQAAKPGDAYIANDDEGAKHWVTNDWYPDNFTIVVDTDPLP